MRSDAVHLPRRAAVALFAALILLAAGVASALAADQPFPSPAPGQYVYDPDNVLTPQSMETAESVAEAVVKAKGLAPLVLVRRAGSDVTPEETAADAAALVRQWGARRSVVALLDVPVGCGGEAAVVRTPDLNATRVPDAALAAAADSARQFLATCDADGAVLTAMTKLTPTLLGSPPAARPSAAASGGRPAASTSARPAASAFVFPTVAPIVGTAGPPFPDPVPGQYVYDTAGVFRPETIEKVQAQIQAIRERTGAEVAVYSQVVGPFVDEARAEADARALMDQWGVGRRGFDDGLVVLFDLDLSREHGQVQLYAGPGYRATFLSNQDRQAIFDNDMLPLLKEGDLDGALLAGMDKVDANATPEHAQTLERGRQINAVIGLVGAPVALILLVAFPLLRWLRYGRDPTYLDDPSILMPAPPPDLTAAAGALVFDGQSSRHTLTTAMLDLASRDELAFRPEVHTLGRDKLGIEVRNPYDSDARIRLNRRRPISPAESYARSQLAVLAKTDEEGAEMVDSKALLGFGPKVSGFDERLESYATDKGWFTAPPQKVTKRWYGLATLEIIGGIGIVIAGASLPADGLVLLGGAIAIAGGITLPIARAMPARSLSGAVIRAMLAAYRRTLEKTLAMSRSMDQVVASKVLPWLETPDQAVVWGVALGLRRDVETVLERTASDLSAGRAEPSGVYMPHWYGARGWSSGESGGGGGIAPGLFSGSAVPNFGSMMSAIGTIGNSASSSGGGYGGGGSGGGGGGAGGGF